MSKSKSKGKGTATPPSSAPKVERYTAPLSAKAPRVMVTDGNKSVEHQITAAGGCVENVWSIDAAIRTLADCDGLVITGGGDVNPRLYGATPHRQVYGLTSTRDLRELCLLGAARDLGIPVLGICRGMQIIAVEAGGTLYQHVPDKVRHDNHSCSMMAVRTVRGSLVARTLGEYPSMLHLHHQSVKRLPAGFQVTARHADGIVEAIESHDGRVVGVQFHPESVLTSESKGEHYGWRLFDAFVASCNRYRRRARTLGRPEIGTPEYYRKRWPVAVEAYDKSFSGYRTSSTTPTFSSSSTPTVIGGKSEPKSEPKADDSGASQGGKVYELTPKSKALVRVLDHHLPPIVAWCGPCGTPFEVIDDYYAHMDFFHPGVSVDWPSNDPIDSYTD